jgi:hypothetical protein
MKGEAHLIGPLDSPPILHTAYDYLPVREEERSSEPKFTIMSITSSNVWIMSTRVTYADAALSLYASNASAYIAPDNAACESSSWMPGS